jgi:signal transduction histidine kinase
MTNENLLIEGGQQQSLADGIDCTRLTAGIGHDFNHVLNIIRGYAELLLEELRQNDATRWGSGDLFSLAGKDEVQCPSSSDLWRIRFNGPQKLGEADLAMEQDSESTG